MIQTIRLQNFRSYKDASFEFEPGVNIIVGPNASGKTNLLEALLVLALGSSYRAKDHELVAFNKPWARLDGYHEQQSRSLKLKKTDGRSQKEFVIDAQVLKRLHLHKTIPVVLFEPNHLLLLQGSPEGRRDYLDNLLEQLTAGYAQLRRQYRRALAQRNALLKHGRASADQFFVWNVRLSEIGGQMAKQRQDLVEKLQDSIQALYSELAGQKSRLVLGYDSHFEPAHYSSQLLRKLEISQEQDSLRGFTTHGPHRDDLVVTLNGHPAQESASRGESRTVLLALKLLELKLLEAERSQPPILLLDDVFSELDGKRRRALTESLKDHQTFITTTDADVVVQHFTNCHIIPLG